MPLPTSPSTLELIKLNLQNALEALTGISYKSIDDQPDMTQANLDPIAWVSVYSGQAELASSSRGRIYNPFLMRSVNYQIEIVLSFVGPSLDTLDNHVLRWIDYVTDQLEILAKSGEVILSPSKTVLKGFRVDSMRKQVMTLGVGLDGLDRMYSVKAHLLCSKHRN